MIVRFVQTDRQPHPRYEFSEENQLLGSADVPQSDQIYIKYNDSNLSLNLSGTKKILSDGKKRSVVEVKSATKVIGNIYQDAVVLRKVFFIPIGYGYITLEMDGEVYNCYEVGLGVDQHYFCVLQGEKTVAMFHKDDIVKNKRDTYTIYMDDGISLEAVMSLAMYIDCTRFPDIGEKTGVGVDNNSHYSSQPELREKFNPDFIPYILGKE